MFIFTCNCMYIMLARTLNTNQSINHVNKYIFIYWIIFSSYNLWTSCKKSLKIPKGQPETVYRRSIDMNINTYFHFVHTPISIDMNINAYFHLVHTSISIDMNINAYFYIVVLTILRHYCFFA